MTDTGIGGHIMETPYGYIMVYVTGDDDREGSLHIACSRDGKQYTALNGNSGILYVRINPENDNKTLSTGYRFDGVSLVRTGDSFTLVARQGADTGVKYIYSSDDLLEYTLTDIVGTGHKDNDLYEKMYDDAQMPADGLVIPENAKNCSVVGVNKTEFHKITDRFDIGEKYSGYPNPFIEQRADPYIIYDDENKCYYFTASYPAYYDADHGYDRIILRKADSLSGLADENGGKEKEITIWRAPSEGLLAKHIWAPEMHKINGSWYVFFAAGSSTNIWAIRPYVLVCQNNAEPYNEDSWKKGDGSYEVHAATSKDERYFKNMSLDMTHFEHKGKHYVIWADIIGQSTLYMQEINPSKPWEGISDTVVKLTAPEYGWERDCERVNEGAAILKHDDRIFCAFSASGTGPEYCIGLLYADADSDLMNENSWTKLPYPLLTSADVPGEYGPGHNSFTVDAGGNPVFVYHARSEECYNNKCEWAECSPLYDPCRHARVKNVQWTKDGFPILKVNNQEENTIH